MKYSSIKKVALGLFLAAYATSSVFASQTVTATNAIQGNAPILRAKDKENDKDFNHTVTVTVSTDKDGVNPINGANNSNQTKRAAKVGDFIVIKYKVVDDDGDEDQGAIKDKLGVFYKDISSNDWVDATNKVEIKSTTNGDGVSFPIPEVFAGVSKIGFKLLETTKYGLPNTNQWLLTTDIWATSKPNLQRDDPANANNNPKDPGVDNGNDAYGPGVVTAGSGKGPIESDNLRIGIFKYNTQASDIDRPIVNYAQSNSQAIPKYGDTFKVIVWMDQDQGSDGVYDPLVDKNMTKAYKYVWTVSGKYNNISANTTQELPGTSSSDTNISGMNDLITLGSENVANKKHNDMYPGNSYVAGIQGYNLVVTTK